MRIAGLFQGHVEVAFGFLKTGSEPDEAKHGRDIQKRGGAMATAMLSISRSAQVLVIQKDEIFRSDACKQKV